MEEFIGVTISDLNGKYLPLTIKSINSFLKFHNTKLIVYIIGDNELPIADEHIEVIRLPKVDYSEYNLNITHKGYLSHIDILIQKLLCLTKQKNFIFFENDVFFFKNMGDVWEKMNDGVGLVPVNHKLMNSGLIIAKHTDVLSYTEHDVIKYFTERKVFHPCDEFLTSWCTGHIHQLDDEACILVVPPRCNKKIDILNTTCHSVHCVEGKHFILNPERYNKLPVFITELLKK